MSILKNIAYKEKHTMCNILNILSCENDRNRKQKVSNKDVIVTAVVICFRNLNKIILKLQ